MTYLDDNKNVMTEGEYLELCNDMKEVYNFKKNIKQINIEEQLLNNRILYNKILNELIDNLERHSNIRKLFIDNDTEIIDYIMSLDFYSKKDATIRYSDLLDKIQSRYIENNYNTDTIYLPLNTIKSSFKIMTTELFDNYLIKDKLYMNSIIDTSIYRKKLLRKWII